MISLDNGVDKVEISGARDEEIWVEVPPELLLQLDLTISDIANKISRTSQDFPSGDLSADVKIHSVTRSGENCTRHRRN